MSDPYILPAATAPWLRAQIEHRFGQELGSFHLHVSFEAHAMRTVVFGPSGSGKSSLLRAIAGLFEPHAGKIELHGETVWSRSIGQHSDRCLPPENRLVGLVMQSPAIFPHLSVAGNVAFALGGMESPARREKVLHLLQTVDAESLAQRWPRQLSGGQL